MPKTAQKSKPDRFTVGWREWLGLPDLGVPCIKAKIDTGARSSSLHVTNLKVEETATGEIARFRIHPTQRHNLPIIEASAPILEWREIRSSNGHRSRRPVVVTSIRIGTHEYEVELTLTGRDQMGFRMLLGRQGLRGRALVDPGRSYLQGKINA